ncbi:hypothetical protein E8E11_010107 [Didymella keratinophila]|nr:hypothetical protein E8E11_010107 [Didymella keratinophila]
MVSKNKLQNVLERFNLSIDEDRDRLIIGVDFGTTYSGIAYAFTGKPDEIHSVREWPGAPGQNKEKAPTVMKYDEDKSFKWGYQLDRTLEDKISGIKLLLDPDQETPLFDSGGKAATKAEIAKLEKEPLEIASDYMQAIYKHALEEIRKNIPKGYLDTLDKEFVLSVPAVWSDKAKDATMLAAKNAGIVPIELIKEPEAAALYTLNQLKGRGLEVGDAVTICDAGGGTVDLVSYEILKMWPDLELRELVPSSGGIAGSLMINNRFEDFIKQTIGEDVLGPLKKGDSWRRALKDFDDNIKPGFQGRGDEPKFVSFPMANLPDKEESGVSNGHVRMTGDDLHGIFDPVFKEINRLVEEQVNRVLIKRKGDPNIKAIFLVGGFGSSRYLLESIQKAHKETQVIQPSGAWSAIVQGAVLYKLPHQATVKITVADHHYGIDASVKFDAQRDTGHEHLKFFDKWEEIDRVHRMQWYINRGDDLVRSRSIEHAFISTCSIDPTPEELNATYYLMSCASNKAPEYPDEDVVGNCALTIDLSGVPRSSWKKKSRPSDGVEFYEISFKLLIQVEGARLTFSFESGGLEYGAVNAEY